MKVREVRTVVIWDTLGTNPIQFFVVEGNKSRWDNVYLNALYDTPEQTDAHNELMEFMYPPQLDGNEREDIEWLDHFPIGGFDFVVVAGFIP